MSQTYEKTNVIQLTKVSMVYPRSTSNYEKQTKYKRLIEQDEKLFFGFLF